MIKPIIYRYNMPTRFSDLDSYNHVNFKHYFDYVINSRIFYMQNRFKIGLFELAESTGIGFYVTESTIKYLRPIKGVTTVEIESHVEEVQNDTLLKIPFRIFHPASGKIYSEGRIDFSIVDVKTGRVTTMTKDVKDLLFEEITE